MKALYQSLATRQFMTISLSAAAMILLSKISIPFIPVPMTLQTLGVLCIGLICPPMQAFLSIVTWFAMGIVGIPVFATMAVGPAILAGPTMGYILGMILAAPLVSFSYRYFSYNGIFPVILACLLGEFVVFFSGWLWLSNFLQSYATAFQVGVVPFVLADSFKVAVAVLGQRVFLNQNHKNG